MIEIKRRADVIKSAPDRWKAQYERHSGTNWEKHQKITHELQALNSTEFTAEDVNKIIGNESWTALRCDECGVNSEVLCSIGTDTEWGGPAGFYCDRCLREALFQLDNEP